VYKRQNQNSGGGSGIGMIRKVIRSAEDGQRPVTEELVDVPTGVDEDVYKRQSPMRPVGGS